MAGRLAGTTSHAYFTMNLIETAVVSKTLLPITCRESELTTDTFTTDKESSPRECQDWEHLTDADASALLTLQSMFASPNPEQYRTGLYEDLNYIVKTWLTR